jgi:hypothetical protein
METPEELMIYKEKYEKLLKQRNAAVKKWQSKNIDRVSVYKKAYFEKNKDKWVKTSTNYNNNNKDKYKEYQNTYRQSKLLRKLPFWNDDESPTD